MTPANVVVVKKQSTAVVPKHDIIENKTLQHGREQAIYQPISRA